MKRERCCSVAVRGRKCQILPQFTCSLLSDMSASPSVLFSPTPLFLSRSLPSENSEICPDDKQRNKAKSDEVRRTHTPSHTLTYKGKLLRRMGEVLRSCTPLLLRSLKTLNRHKACKHDFRSCLCKLIFRGMLQQGGEVKCCPSCNHFPRLSSCSALSYFNVCP